MYVHLNEAPASVSKIPPTICITDFLTSAAAMSGAPPEDAGHPPAVVIGKNRLL